MLDVELQSLNLVSVRPGAFEIDAIEHAAFLSWPAEEVVELAGWQLRTMRGVTRRANSVHTAAGRVSGNLAQRIDEVESFYSERGLATRFQMSPKTAPAELDATLAARGYVVEAPVAVMTADAKRFASLEVSATVTVQRQLDEEWFELSGCGGRYRGVESTYRGLLARLPSGALFALAREGGTAAAVGLAVVHGDLCGIFSMLTREPARRCGLGRAVLVRLARAGSALGATSLYLQVEHENNAALALYAGAGFERAYDYVYRLRP